MRRIVEWNSFERFDEATRDGFVDVRPDGTVGLKKRVVLADEMGRANSRDVEVVENQTCLKKTFLIPDPGDAGGTLGLYMFSRVNEDQAFTIEVNGCVQETVFPKSEARTYWERGWHRVEVSPVALVKGTNEVIVRACHGSLIHVGIENCVHPNRSAKSRDGGLTWDYDHLGYNDSYDGEYLIRLELNAHQASGSITSSPVDIATAFSNKPVGAAVTLEKINIRAEADKPKGTGILLEMRTGSDPDPDAMSWGRWKTAKEMSDEDFQSTRFVQWRATLSTRDVTVSPTLKKVKLSLTGDVSKQAGAGARISDDNNPSILRSSYPFAWQRVDDVRSNMLRDRWRLDSVVAPAETEFQKFELLRQWTREQWEDGWNRGPIKFVPPWDTLLILELASRQLALGMCTHYATVMTHCCAALGLPARTVVLQNHCINEVWSNDHRKWVAMDAGCDTNDSRKATYHFERDGVPMSFFEVHEAWLSQDFESIRFSPESVHDAFTLEERMKLFDRFMVNMRNDELTSLEPGEPEHGEGAYAYDRYLHWEDDRTPPLPWFSRTTRRKGDLFWSLNQTHMYVRESADSTGVEVQIDHCTPNFSHFEISVDQSPFEPCEALSVLSLSKGSHTIAARTVDSFGARGIESDVSLIIR